MTKSSEYGVKITNEMYRWKWEKTYIGDANNEQLSSADVLSIISAEIQRGKIVTQWNSQFERNARAFLSLFHHAAMQFAKIIGS